MQTRDIDALRVALPSMTEGVSLINFLIELKDFRRLAESFRKREGTFFETLFTGSSTRQSAYKKSPLATLKKASGTFLTYKFALAPFVSDALKLWDGLSTVEKRLGEIRRRAGQPQTRHVSWPIGPDVYDADWVYQGVVVAAPNFSIHSWKKTRSLTIPVYRATVRYTYRYPDISNAQAKVRGILDTLGVRPDPSIIWNAIPFTFLVDWVVNVGGFLRRFSTDNLGLQTTVEDFCSSQKAATVVDYGWSLRWNGTSGEDTVTPIATCYHKFYDRRVVLPNLFASVQSTGLSTTELALGTALVGANIRY